MKRTGFWLAVVLAAAAAGTALSFRPWKAYLEQRRIANANQHALAEAETRKAEFARQKAKLESRIGKEEKAREHNYVRPGEEGAS